MVKSYETMEDCSPLYPLYSYLFHSSIKWEQNRVKCMAILTAVHVGMSRGGRVFAPTSEYSDCAKDPWDGSSKFMQIHVPNPQS